MAKLDELDSYYQQKFLEAQTLGAESDEEILRRLLAQQQEQERLTQEQDAAYSGVQSQKQAADQQRIQENIVDELRDPYPILPRDSEENLTRRISQKEEELTRQIWSQLNADPDYSHLTVEQLEQEARRLMREKSPMAWFQEGYTSKPAGDRAVSGVDVPDLMRKVQTEDGRISALGAGASEVMKRQVLKPAIKEGEPSTDIGRYLLEQIDDETYAKLANEYPLFGIRWANEEGQRPFLPPARSTRQTPAQQRATPQAGTEDADEWRRRYEAFKEITVSNEEIEAQREEIKVKLEKAYREAQREAEETVLQKYRDEMHGEAARWVDQAMVESEASLTSSDSEYEELRESAIESLIDTVLQPYIDANLPEVAGRRKKREKGEEDKESGIIAASARDLWNWSTTAVDERGIVETAPRAAGRVVFNSVVNAITEIGSGAVGWEERADGSPVDPNDPNYIIWKQNHKRLQEGGSPWDPRYLGSYAFSVPMQRTLRDENAWRKPLPEVIVDSNATAIGQMYDRWIMSTLGSVQKSRYVGDDLATTRAFQQSMEAIGVNPELAALGLSLPILIGTPVTPFSTFNKIWRGTKAVTATTSDIGLEAAAWVWKAAEDKLLSVPMQNRLLNLGDDLASGKIVQNSHAVGEFLKASGDILFSATPLQAAAATKGKRVQAGMLNSIAKEVQGARYADASMLRDMATRAANRLVTGPGDNFVSILKNAEANATDPEAVEAIGQILSEVTQKPSLLKPERAQDLMEVVTDKLHSMLLQAVPNDIVYAIDNKDILMSGKTMDAMRKPRPGFRKNSIMDDINESTRDWVKIEASPRRDRFRVSLDSKKLEGLKGLRGASEKVENLLAKGKGGKEFLVDSDEMLALKYWTKGNLQLQAARGMGDGVVSGIRHSAHYRSSAFKALGEEIGAKVKREARPSRLETKAAAAVPRANVERRRRQQTFRALETLGQLFKPDAIKAAVWGSRKAAQLFGKAIDDTAVATLKDKLEPWTDPRVITTVENFATEIGAVPGQFNILLQQNQRLTGKPVEAFLKTVSDIYAQSTNPAAQSVENFYSTFLGYFFNAPEAKGLPALKPKSTPQWTVGVLGGKLKDAKVTKGQATFTNKEIRALLNAYRHSAGIEAFTSLTREHLSNLVRGTKQAVKGEGALYRAAKETVDGDLVLQLHKIGKSSAGLKRSGFRGLLDNTFLGWTDGNLMAALGVSAQREMVEQIWYRMGKYLRDQVPGGIVRIEPEPTRFPEVAPGMARLQVHEQLVATILASHFEKLIRQKYGDDSLEIYTALVADLTRTGKMTDQGVEDWLLDAIQTKIASSDILEDTRRQLRSFAPGQAYETPRRTPESPEVRRAMEEGTIDEEAAPGQQAEMFRPSVPFVGPASEYKTFLYDELMRRIKPVASRERGLAKLREFPSGIRPVDLTRKGAGGTTKVQEMESLGRDKALMGYRREIEMDPDKHARNVDRVINDLVANRSDSEVKSLAKRLAFEAKNPDPKEQKIIRGYYDDRSTWHLMDMLDHIGDEEYWINPNEGYMISRADYDPGRFESPWVFGLKRPALEELELAVEAHAPVIKKLWEKGLAFQDDSPGSLSDFVNHYKDYEPPAPLFEGKPIREDQLVIEDGRRVLEVDTFNNRDQPVVEKYYVPDYEDYPFTLALYEWLGSVKDKVRKAIDEEYEVLSGTAGFKPSPGIETLEQHWEKQRSIKRPLKEMLRDPNIVPVDLQEFFKVVAKHPDANQDALDTVWPRLGGLGAANRYKSSSYLPWIDQFRVREDIGGLQDPPWWRSGYEENGFLRDEYRAQEWLNTKAAAIKFVKPEDSSILSMVLEKIMNAFPRPNSERWNDSLDSGGYDWDAAMRKEWQTWGTPAYQKALDEGKIDGRFKQFFEFSKSIDRGEEVLRHVFRDVAPLADRSDYSLQMKEAKKSGLSARVGHRLAPSFVPVNRKEVGAYTRQASEDLGQIPYQNLRAEAESILLEEQLSGQGRYQTMAGIHKRGGLREAYQEDLTEQLEKSRGQMESFIKKREGGPDSVQVIPIYGDPRNKDVVETMLKQPKHYGKTSKAVGSWEGLSPEHSKAFNDAMESLYLSEKGRGFPIAYHISKMESGEITEEMMVYARDLGAEFNKHFPKTEGIRPITFVKPVQTGIADQGKSLTWKDLKKWSVYEDDVATPGSLEQGRPIRSAPPTVTPRVPYKGTRPDEYGTYPMMTVGPPKEIVPQGPLSAPRPAPLSPDPKAPGLRTRWRGKKRVDIQEEILPVGSPARARALERLAEAGFIDELEGKEKIFWLSDPLTAIKGLSESPERIRNLVQQGLETAVYRYTSSTTADIHAQMLKAGFPVGLTDIGNADAMGPKLLQIDPNVYMMTDPLIAKKIEALRGTGIEETFGEALNRLQPKELGAAFVNEAHGLWMASRRMQASGLMGLSPRYQGINIISWPLIMMVTNPAFMLRTVTTMATEPGSTVKRSLAERFGGRQGRRVGTFGGEPLLPRPMKRAWDNYFSGGADTPVFTAPDGTIWTQRMLDTEMRNHRALFSQVAFEFTDTDIEEMRNIAMVSPDLTDPLKEYLSKMDSTTRGFNKEWFKLMAEGPARGGQEWARWLGVVFDPRNKTAFNRFAEAMDESFRRAAFIAALQAGESVDDAATVARTSILDYQRTTKAERRVFAKFRLFYSFVRNSIVETLEALARMDQGSKNMRAWWIAQNHIKKLMGTYMSQPDYADHSAFVLPTGEADYTPQMWKVGDVPFIQALNTFTTGADVLYYGSPKEKLSWIGNFIFQDPASQLVKDVMIKTKKEKTDPRGFTNPRVIMRYKAADDFVNHFVERSKKNGTWTWAQDLYGLVPSEKPIPGGPMFEGSQWRFNDEAGFNMFAGMTYAALTTNTERLVTEMATAYFIAKGDTFSLDKADRIELKRFKGGIVRAVIYISGVGTPIQGTSEQQRELNMLWHAKQAVSGAEKTR